MTECVGNLEVTENHRDGVAYTVGHPLFATQ